MNNRSTCCVCSKGRLNKVIEIENFPIYMGTTTKNYNKDLFKNQKWGNCDECGTLQLINLIDLATLYAMSHHEEVVGSTWERHHLAFSNFIKIKTGEKICELGSAHDHLATLLLEEYGELDYLSIEPSPTRINPKIRHLRGFAEDYMNEISECNVIIHSHVLEHIYNPKDFLTSISNAMNPGTRMYISFPNIKQLLNQKGSNALNFEHTYFLTLEVFKFMAIAAGLSVDEIFEFEQHSYFVMVSKNTEHSNNINLHEFENSNLFLVFWRDIDDFVQYVNIKLKEARTPTYIFGAHIFAQALLARGVKEKDISGILDNSSSKQGKRMYGSNLSVYAPAVIANLEKVRVVLRASHYQDEIRAQLTNLNPRVQIIESIS